MSNGDFRADGLSLSSGDQISLPTVAGALPDAVVVIDSLASLRWANAAAERLFGVTLDGAVGRNGLDLIHPDDLQFAALSMASVRAKDVGTLIELRIRAWDGWRLVEMLGAPLGDDIVLSLRDVTERRRWEVTGDDAARFRSLMQNAASLTLMVSSDGIVESSSGVLTRLLGHDQEWLEGRPLVDIVDVQDHSALEEALRAVVATGSSAERVTVDIGLRTAGDGVIPYALTFTNLTEDPTVEGVVVTGHDITDRVQAEAALRAAHSVLAATLESTADGILVVDNTGRISSFNSRFAQLWHVTDEVLQSGSDNQALALVLEQLCDPGAFVAKIQELYATPDAHSHDLIDFKDGRVFERDSLPQRIDGEIVGRVWSFRDVTEQTRLQADLAHQAFHDPLTGLANRALFRDRVDHATARLSRHGTTDHPTLAVLFIDLDDFKTVNDSLGHAGGDTLLIEVSERLTNLLRPVDTAVRLGGDEFVLLLEDLDAPRDAITIARRIVTMLQEPVMVLSETVSARASIGIAFGTADVECDELLRNADLAMYMAKAAGKNCYRVFAPEMHGAAVERLSLEVV